MLMKIGFTGSRQGLSWKQIHSLYKIREVHHGNWIAADEEFQQICHKLNIPIEIHPPIDQSKRVFCQQASFNKTSQPYLKHNQNIVDAYDLLIACPTTPNEKQRSGTWPTTRYARQKKTVVQLISKQNNNGRVA